MATRQDKSTDAYEALLDRYQRLACVRDSSMVLSWDQQVMMPEGGTPARAKQLSALSAVVHDLITADEFEVALREAEDTLGALDEDQTAVVREIHRKYDRQANVPNDLVATLAETKTESQSIWKDAKADDSFTEFAPSLKKLKSLHVKRAKHISPDKPPYEVLYEDSEPYLPLEKVEHIFERLKDKLIPLIDQIRSEGRTLPDPFAGRSYDEESQRALSEAALDHIDYDRMHGRLDTSPHPFTSGNQFDARITTRYKEGDPLDALMATVHEYGHASYMLGLPRSEYGTPLGESLSSGVHESQSRFWENHVARTKPFWELFTPVLTDHLAVDDLAAEDAYAAVNRIYSNNYIRVEADELTYHLHIILRCEIDRAFLEGDISVDEIPEMWNQKMERYLGVTPPTDRKGCLQDIHWSSRFAAFQAYTIGSVLAAQLDAVMREEIDDVDHKIRNGEFGPLREWMERNVHSHGRKYPTDTLIEEATGEPLTADYFLNYVDEKFTDLYNL